MKKRYLKALIIFLGLFALTGCFGNFTPSERVEDMFNRYIKNDKDIMDELDDYMSLQNLNSAQQEKYKDIIKNEYATIKYDIKDEQINGDEAVVKADIEVKDLYKASKEAGKYLADNSEDFYVDGNYNRDKFIDYKLDQMQKYGETVKYTIDIDLVLKEGIWTIEQLDEETLEKIHGIYDYENDQTA